MKIQIIPFLLLTLLAGCKEIAMVNPEKNLTTPESGLLPEPKTVEPVDPAPKTPPPTEKGTKRPETTTTTPPKTLPPCQGLTIDQPAPNHTAGLTGTWYAARRVHIPIDSTRVFCAPVMAPLVPNIKLSAVTFALRNEMSQNCGTAKITVEAPDPNLAPKDSGYYGGSGGATFSNASKRNPKAYSGLAPRGVYRITVEAVDRNNSDYHMCTEWEVSWKATW